VLIAPSIFLLTWRLGERCFWVDEINTVIWSQKPVASLLEKTDVYPPLYFIIVHFWTQWFGQSEFAYRLISALPSVFTVLVLYKLGSELCNKSVGLLAAALLAFSPFFILFSRMARYYSLTTLLATLSFYFFLRVLRREGQKNWVGYVISSILLIYTHYLPGSVLIFQNIFILVNARLYRGLMRTWIFSQVLIFIGFLPWLAKMLSQVGEFAILPAAELATGPKGIFMKTAYPFFSFALGQTIFPWNWVIVIPMMALCLYLFMNGTIKLFRLGVEYAVGPLALFFVLAFGILITSTIAKFEQTSHLPCLIMFTAPLFYLILARAAFIAPNRFAVLLIIVLLGAAEGYGLFNYFAGRQFHNPQYVLPWREIVSSVDNHWESGDVIVHVEPSFTFYKKSPLLEMDFHEAQKQVLQQKKFRRVWILIRDRGHRELVDGMLKFGEKLHPDFHLVDEVAFYPLSASEREFKEKILGRHVLGHNVILRLYVK